MSSTLLELNILNSLISSKDIHLNNAGKHILDFDEDFPLTVKLINCKLDYRLTPNYHDYLEIATVYKGKGRCLVGDQEYVINTGDTVFINNVELHTFLADFKEDLILMVIFFIPELIYVLGEKEYNLDYLKPFYYREDNFRNIIMKSEIEHNRIPDLITEIYNKVNNREKYYKASVKVHLLDILVTLLKTKKDIPYDSQITYDKNINHINRLSKTFSLIMNNYQRPISLEEAADSAFMSANYFCNFFKKVTGQTFKEFLLRVRIDKAKELLLENNATTTEIAYDVGFDNLSFFFRTFKRFTGVCPSEFRSSLLNE